MTAWLNPLRGELDAADSPVTVFVRDDDAGWDDTRLTALLDLFDRYGAPIDLAVIPRELHPDLARELRRRKRDATGGLGLHQHGYAHVNHEPEGRKCEFGPVRSVDEQTRDIATGRRLLLDLLGPDLDPIFTPPWNRCTQDTGVALRTVGIDVLSRDATATPLDERGVSELVVQVDWFASRRGVRLDRTELGVVMAERAAGDAPLGVMLHHAAMDTADFAGVEELLDLLTGHPNVAMHPMAALIGAPATTRKDMA